MMVVTFRHSDIAAMLKPYYKAYQGICDSLECHECRYYTGGGNDCESPAALLKKLIVTLEKND
jgi:hypothetical protein